MNNRGPLNGRHDNSDKIRAFMRESENTMTYNLNDMHGNKFLGSWNKFMTLEDRLNWEQKEKYTTQISARFNSKLEIGSVPVCFDKCIQDVEGALSLSPNEKNCLRECYLKRISSRDDLLIMVQQRLSLDYFKNLRDLSV